MLNRVRLVVAEDHAIVREGLCRLLSLNDRFSVCGEAGTGEEAVSLAETERPDIVLMDISMPGINGIEATQRIKTRHPDIRILILTAYEDKNLVQLALKAGADGYLLKNVDRERLAEAIDSVLSEGAYLAPELNDIDTEFESGEDYTALTRREKEIFNLVAAGRKNREISEKLCISVKTVEKHRANLMRKLGLHSVAELVSYALKTGFLLVEEDT